MSEKKGVLIVNLGTPKSTSVSDVRSYLREFLMDERVIDIPFVSRWLLVNVIIATFRAPKSAEEYKKVWTSEGSPLKVYGQRVEALLQQQLGSEYVVSLGMRYQEPNLEKALEPFHQQGIKDITIIPLFPQYASATTGSVTQRVMEIVKNWQLIPNIRFIEQFFDHPAFIQAWKEIASDLVQPSVDHYVFSYHGLPERQIHKASVEGYCQLGDCCQKLTFKNRYCYRAQCFATTRLMAEVLGISNENYSVCFQSRLGKDPWIQPYIDDTLNQLIDKGVKNVVAFSPAFVSDCLETTVEIGEFYKEQFIEKGGESWTLVPSLNDHPAWVSCLEQLIKGD